MLYFIRKVNNDSPNSRHIKKIVMNLNTFQMCHLIKLYKSSKQLMHDPLKGYRAPPHHVFIYVKTWIMVRDVRTLFRIR